MATATPRHNTKRLDLASAGGTRYSDLRHRNQKFYALMHHNCSVACLKLRRPVRLLATSGAVYISMSQSLDIECPLMIPRQISQGLLFGGSERTRLVPRPPRRYKGVTLPGSSNDPLVYIRLCGPTVFPFPTARLLRTKCRISNGGHL